MNQTDLGLAEALKWWSEMHNIPETLRDLCRRAGLRLIQLNTSLDNEFYRSQGMPPWTSEENKKPVAKTVTDNDME
jgi:hypothetical protein